MKNSWLVTVCLRLLIVRKIDFCDITRDTPGTSAEEFKASKGWFDNFKKRTEIHSVVRHGEATS